LSDFNRVEAENPVEYYVRPLAGRRPSAGDSAPRSRHEEPLPAAAEGKS